jgi:hypothetical protein
MPATSVGVFMPASGLGPAIRTFYKLDCADPGDKIYALLGVVQPEHQVDIDYSKPTSTVNTASRHTNQFESSIIRWEWLAKSR